MQNREGGDFSCGSSNVELIRGSDSEDLHKYGRE